uniref:Mitochondrial cardiolipin hydrolase n=1 Tax=Hyaloperonospora arabidopsidis (strain Emoy2) TaxID=559515 RepID=M4BPU7_HYAAE
MSDTTATRACRFDSDYLIGGNKKLHVLSLVSRVTHNEHNKRMGNCIGIETAVPAAGDSFVDVLFFPDRGMPCKSFHSSSRDCTRKNCKSIHDGGSSLMTLLGFLESAEKSMDICVFTITCDEIAEAVLAAHGRGVKVRIITDDGQAKGKGSDIQKFIDAVYDAAGRMDWYRSAC